MSQDKSQKEHSTLIKRLFKRSRALTDIPQAKPSNVKRVTLPVISLVVGRIQMS